MMLEFGKSFSDAEQYLGFRCAHIRKETDRLPLEDWDLSQFCMEKNFQGTIACRNKEKQKARTKCFQWR